MHTSHRVSRRRRQRLDGRGDLNSTVLEAIGAARTLIVVTSRTSHLLKSTWPSEVQSRKRSDMSVTSETFQLERRPYTDSALTLYEHHAFTARCKLALSANVEV
jgi:hypothetical protein